MAESALSLSLENLRQSIIQKADQLARVEKEIREIEEELERIVHDQAVQSMSSSQFTAQISDVIRRAQDFIDTYTKNVSKSATAGICKRPIYWINELRGARHLKRIRDHASYLHHNLDQRPSVHDSRGGGAPPSRLLDVYFLSQCILYFTLFPAGFQVPTRRLIALWVAEGLIRPNKYDYQEPVEHTAQRYLDELILRGIITAKRKPNGKLQACELIDPDTWLMKAKEANFLHNVNGDALRLIDHNGHDAAATAATAAKAPAFIDLAEDFPPLVPYIYRDVISFLSFDTREGTEAGRLLGVILHRFISELRCFPWLRVLDLERVFRPQLTETLGELVHLRYLGLRWTYLEHIPKFVNKLLKLQVLDVKHTYISVLPKSIWSMQNMRHLYLSEAYRASFPDRPPGTSLPVLQTLWGAFIDENTCVTKGLDDCQEIRKLGLSCRPSRSTTSNMSEQLKAVDKWISNLKFLESLRLKSRDGSGKPSDLHLTSLQGKEHLSTVYLMGKLDPQVVVEFPGSLTDITLSGTELDMDPMEFLGRLPNLRVLRLLARSVACRRLHCSTRDGFPLLQVVKIWKLNNLEEWEVEEGAMPCLEDLEIRSCHKLKKIPDGLKHVDKIKKFKLTSMPPGFTEEIKTSQPELWAKIEQHVVVDSEQL